MYTFRGKKQVRIDYIFHDEALKGLTYYKRELSYSDHYPVFMKMEFNKEENENYNNSWPNGQELLLYNLETHSERSFFLVPIGAKQFKAPNLRGAAHMLSDTWTHVIVTNTH